jgi:DNA polymerase elongation subunit (family B)
LLGRKDYDKNKTITGIDPDDIQFMKFDSEKDLLLRFIQIWEWNYPDIVTGWNVEYFDIQYIVTRILKLLGEDHAKRLSPWNSIQKKTREQFGKPASTYLLAGIAVVDYLDAFRKFGYKYGPQESYKLDHIAHVVLGEKKLSYERFNNHIDTHRFITDGAKGVVIPEDVPDEELDQKEKYVRMRDRLKKEMEKRGINFE